MHGLKSTNEGDYGVDGSIFVHVAISINHEEDLNPLPGFETTNESDERFGIARRSPSSFSRM